MLGLSRLELIPLDNLLKGLRRLRWLERRLRILGRHPRAACIQARKEFLEALDLLALHIGRRSWKVTAGRSTVGLFGPVRIIHRVLELFSAAVDAGLLARYRLEFAVDCLVEYARRLASVQRLLEIHLIVAKGDRSFILLWFLQ